MNEKQVTDAEENQPDREFRRARGLTMPEPNPQPREDWSECDYEQRLLRLEPARRIRPAEYAEPRVAIGEDRQRRSSLLERAPEKNGEHEQHEDRGDAPPFVRGQRFIGANRVQRVAADGSRLPHILP